MLLLFNQNRYSAFYDVLLDLPLNSGRARPFTGSLALFEEGFGQPDLGGDLFCVSPDCLRRYNTGPLPVVRLGQALDAFVRAV